MGVMTYDMIKCIFVDEYASDPDKINTFLTQYLSI